MQRVGVLGTPGFLSQNSDPEVLLEEIGWNTGNMMFQYACNAFTLNPKVFLAGHPDPVGLKDQFDVLLIPAANQINPAADLQWWAELVTALDKPVVIAGLGLQSRIGADADIKLHDGTLRFLHLLKERAVKIGVRGERTRRFLEGLGIHNTLITGCPSNQINASVTGASIQAKIDALRHAEPFTVNLLAGTMEDYTRRAERKLFELASRHQGKVIYQTNKDIFNFLQRPDRRGEATRYLDWERAVLAPNETQERYLDMVQSRGRFYSSVKSWMTDVSGDSLSIGMRIHGAVAAIQGGSLGVCVAFDARTLELAQTMAYPYLMAEQLDAIHDLRDLPGHLAFDARVFDDTRARLRNNLRECIEQHGVMSTL